MPSRVLLLCLCLVALAVSGCGTAERTARDPAAILDHPGAPAPADCATTTLAATRPADDLAPAPGVYTYAVDGTRRLAGGKATPLPRTLRVVTTAARRYGNLRCLRVAHRYGAGVGEVATFVVRSREVYLSELILQTGPQRTVIRPTPPVLSIASSRDEWGWTFSGATHGRYAARTVGHRTFALPGRRVRAVGVELTLEYSGDVQGSERSVRWLAEEDNAVLAEEVHRRRKYGVDELRFDYRSRLRSPYPGARD